MVVLILERVTPGLRGELTRWMLEPNPTVFVGTLSAMVRDRLWDKIADKLGSVGAATMIWSSDTEQGFSMRTLGDTARVVVDFEGLQLVQKPETRIK